MNYRQLIQHKYFLRIVNIEALFLLSIAFVLRLFLFAPQETLVTVVHDNGQTSVATKKVRVTWTFVFSTLFMLAPLAGLFACMEFRAFQKTLGLYCNFLTQPIGRGALLLMMALMLIEVVRTVEVIFCLLVSACALINIAAGITYEVTGFTPEATETTESSLIAEQNPHQTSAAESQKRLVNKSEVYSSI